VTGSEPLDLETGRRVETVPVAALAVEAKREPGLPLTIVKKAPELELVTPEEIIARSGGDLERRVKVLADDTVRTLRVRDVLERHASDPTRPISMVAEVDYLETTTLGHLIAQAQKGEAGAVEGMVRIIRGSVRPHALRVKDLLAGVEGITKDSVFYVHTVRASDSQGVWGIIHDGLIKNFARGMAVHRGREIDTYRIHIPRDADERRTDNSSSFLGRLIDQKTRTSAVYNYRVGRMTRNPDLVVPGDEIVIVNFTPGELVGIYQHFLLLGASRKVSSGPIDPGLQNHAG